MLGGLLCIKGVVISSLFTLLENRTWIVEVLFSLKNTPLFAHLDLIKRRVSFEVEDTKRDTMRDAHSWVKSHRKEGHDSREDLEMGAERRPASLSSQMRCWTLFVVKRSGFLVFSCFRKWYFQHRRWKECHFQNESVLCSFEKRSSLFSGWIEKKSFFMWSLFLSWRETELIGENFASPRNFTPVCPNLSKYLPFSSIVWHKVFFRTRLLPSKSRICLSFLSCTLGLYSCIVLFARSTELLVMLLSLHNNWLYNWKWCQYEMHSLPSQSRLRSSIHERSMRCIFLLPWEKENYRPWIKVDKLWVLSLTVKTILTTMLHAALHESIVITRQESKRPGTLMPSPSVVYMKLHVEIHEDSIELPAFESNCLLLLLFIFLNSLNSLNLLSCTFLSFFSLLFSRNRTHFARKLICVQRCASVKHETHIHIMTEKTW